MDEGELTMIFLDTFYWLRERHTSCWFHDQIDAAQIYCERKIKAHPDNLVGIVIFGSIVSEVVVHPTRDPESIRKRLACLGTKVSQRPDLYNGIHLCSSAWEPYQQMRKRVLVFSAGPLLPRLYDVLLFVNFLKKSRAVVDVVLFGYRPKGHRYMHFKDYKPEENLKALVNAINDNNNNKDSRFFFVEDDGFSLSHHISSSSILQAREEEVVEDDGFSLSPHISSSSILQAKIHTSVGEEEVVDSDWYEVEEVVDSEEEENLALVNVINDNNNNKDSRFFFVKDDGFSHHISSSSILQAKIHTSVGDEVVDSDWYEVEEVVDSEEEEVVYSGWSGSSLVPQQAVGCM